MALVIEYGTEVSGADSFATVAEFTAWAFGLMGETLPGTDAAKESALRRAFVYMGGLDWLPDTYLTFGGSIPVAVKAAQSAFARGELTTPGYLSPTVTLSGKKILTEVKGIRWEVQKGPNTVDAARPVISMGLDYLKPYLRKLPGASGGTSFMERA